MLPASELAGLVRRLDESFAWLEAIHVDLDNCRYELKRITPRAAAYIELRREYLRIEVEWDEAFKKFLKLADQLAVAIEDRLGTQLPQISVQSVHAAISLNSKTRKAS